MYTINLGESIFSEYICTLVLYRFKARLPWNGCLTSLFVARWTFPLSTEAACFVLQQTWTGLCSLMCCQLKVTDSWNCLIRAENQLEKMACWDKNKRRTIIGLFRTRKWRRKYVDKSILQKGIKNFSARKKTVRIVRCQLFFVGEYSCLQCQPVPDRFVSSDDSVLCVTAWYPAHMVISAVLGTGIFVHDEALLDAQDALQCRPELFREPAVQDKVDGRLESQQQNGYVSKDHEAQGQLLKDTEKELYSSESV